jgi:aryl-alcohol dehydrogenase-like predicted oxidoreductase
MSRRLALGTVQFGLRYGIANQTGQVDRDAAASILEHAWAAAMDTLDTAIGYGQSEQRLGDIGVARWQIISKLPPVPADCADVTAWVQESLDGALARLRVPRLYGLLLHHSQELRGPHAAALYRALITAREQGTATKIGVSIYAPEELDALVPQFSFDLVQAPFNVLDRRLSSSGWLRRLTDAETEVHVRSVFLQGLLLMSADRRPPRFAHWEALWRRWHDWLRETQLAPVQACLGFVLSQPEIARVVIGVDTLTQLTEILRAVDAPCALPPPELMSADPGLIDPSRWSVS